MLEETLEISEGPCRSLETQVKHAQLRLYQLHHSRYRPLQAGHIQAYKNRAKQCWIPWIYEIYCEVSTVETELK